MALFGPRKIAPKPAAQPETAAPASVEPASAPVAAVQAENHLERPQVAVTVAVVGADRFDDAPWAAKGDDQPEIPNGDGVTEKTPVTAYDKTYDQWLVAKWADNPYQERYLERAGGDLSAAAAAAASNGGDENAARQAYLKAVFDAPREADVSLAMYEGLPNEAVRVEAMRHFFKLEALVGAAMAAVPDAAPRAQYPDGENVSIGDSVRFEPAASNHGLTQAVEGRVTDIDGARLRIEFDVEQDGDLAAYVEVGTGAFQRRQPPQMGVPPAEQLPPPPDEVTIDLPAQSESAPTPQTEGESAGPETAEPKTARTRAARSRPVLTGRIGKAKAGLWADSPNELTGEIGGQRVIARIGKGHTSHKPFLSVVRAEDNVQLGYATALNTIGGKPVKEGTTRYMILNPDNPDDEGALFGRLYITEDMAPELFDRLGFLGEQSVAPNATRGKKAQPQM